MAFVVESTEGTPVDPSAATEFVALQPDVEMTPSFDLLVNDELRSSIGKTKSLQGFERPKGSFSHYLKHSNVEGQAPEVSSLLKAAFGSQTTNSTQRTATSGSAVGSVVLAAGGTDFARGFAVLIKDGTNGYAIRPVLSVSTNTLTLGFNLPTGTAPASGVTMGKCVNFSPANSGFQSLSAWLYRANGQAVDMIAGAKLTDFSFNASAGQFVKGKFSFAGTKYFFNPIRISASTKYIDFLNGVTDYHASVAVQVYRDPVELADAIATAMNAADTGHVYTVTYDSTTGKFTIAATGSTFSIKWNSGDNTANTIATKIGFSAAADSTAALTYTSATAQSYAAGYTPSYDAADPVVAKAQEVFLGSATDTTVFNAASIDFNMSNERTEVKDVTADSGIRQIAITKREVTVKISALINKFDVDKFKRMRANSDTAFCYNFGNKSGGNWVAGQCGCLYMPSCTVSSFQLKDLDSVVGLEMELKAFVDSSGNGEVYLNFL